MQFGIGGVSATFHGSATVTCDLDICYSRSSQNLPRLVRALEAFHPGPRGEIDLLAEVAGLGNFDGVVNHAILVEAFGRRIATLDLPGLILSKRAAGREKDVAALPELESLLESAGPVNE
jgi:hypothetical protein